MHVTHLSFEPVALVSVLRRHLHVADLLHLHPEQVQPPQLPELLLLQAAGHQVFLLPHQELTILPQHVTIPTDQVPDR